MNLTLIFLSAFWLAVPVIAWLDKKYVYRPGLFQDIEYGNIYQHYLIQSLSEVFLLTIGILIGRLLL
jgi:hypothetical protein